MENEEAAAPTPQWRRAWWRIAPLTILVVVLGKAVSVLVSGYGFADPWYDALERPLQLPIDWIFPFAWPITCVILGIVWALVLSVPPSRQRWWGLALFYGALVLNFLWLPVFLVGHDLGMAKLMLAVRAILLAIAAAIFLKVRRVAGLLLMPYLLWIIFVTALITGIERLNPAAGESIIHTAEGQINAVRKEDRRRFDEGDEWPGRDDRRDGPGGRGDDPREDPRMDRGGRRDQPR